MHNAKSYMVPKMIFANVLAVIMMTFEGHAPAEINEKPQKVIGNQPSRTGSMQADGVVKVADNTQNESDETQVQKEPVAAKKRIHNNHRANAKTPRIQLVKAKSAPVDCCFRGYRS
jgi:hypothetical protein